MANYLTEQDRQNYGDELLDFTTRAAAQASQQVLGPQLQALEQQQTELRQRLALEARARVDQAVERAIPNFREIDQRADWRSWLCQTDSLSGQIRQRLLDAAVQRGDERAVIAFFRGFLAEQGQAPPGRTQSAARGSASAAPSGRIWSREDVTKFYAAKRQGRYSEAEAARLENDLFQAQKDGRLHIPHPYITK